MLILYPLLGTCVGVKYSFLSDFSPHALRCQCPLGGKGLGRVALPGDPAGNTPWSSGQPQLLASTWQMLPRRSRPLWCFGVRTKCLGMHALMTVPGHSPPVSAFSLWSPPSTTVLGVPGGPCCPRDEAEPCVGLARLRCSLRAALAARGEFQSIKIIPRGGEALVPLLCPFVLPWTTQAVVAPPPPPPWERRPV